MSRSTTTLSVACLGLVCVVCGSLPQAFVSSATRRQGPASAVVGAARAGPLPVGPDAEAPGAAFGASFSVGVLAAVGAAVGGGLRRGRVAARALPGQPSLIQVLEQKNLLSLVEKLGLLSTAEKAGVSIALPERLGLLKFAEDNSLLTLLENVLTDKSTVPKALFAGAALAAAALAIGTAEVDPDVQFTQGVFAGAFGAPALVFLGAAGVIGFITSGTTRTVDLDIEEKSTVYNPAAGKGFTQETKKTPVSLLSVIEDRRLLTFLEENRLLSLAAGLGSAAGITRPLTLTEQSGILSTLEKTKILSAVEGTSSNTFAAFLPLVLAGGLLVGALVALFTLEGALGVIAALILGLGGVALFAVAAVLGILQAPKLDILKSQKK